LPKLAHVSLNDKRTQPLNWVGAMPRAHRCARSSPLRH
jgi:hypothetical protein